jgi:hypothetical protein
MKLGNTSQSIVPVPNFFLNTTHREVDTFKVPTRRRYFREKDLFRHTKDLNFSNNRRQNNKKLEEYNKEKYVPVHKKEMNLNFRNLQGSLTGLKYGQDDIYLLDSDRVDKDDTKKLKSLNSEFGKFTQYMEKTNVSKITKGDVRGEISSNIKELLEKINTNLDMKEYNKFDKKQNSMIHNTVKFTPITTFNQNNENETDRFKRTLKEKLSSLTVVDKNSKEKALLSLKFNHNSSREEIGRKSSVEKTTKLNSTTNMSILRLPNLNLESKSRRVAQTADAPYNYTTNSLHKTNSNTIYASMKTTGMNNNNISPQNNSMNATEFENFKEYSIYNNNPESSDLRQFRIPSKKNYQRKKENELMRKTRDNDPYLSTIKDENYNSIKYKQSFNENYKFENIKTGDDGNLNITTRMMNMTSKSVFI